MAGTRQNQNLCAVYGLEAFGMLHFLNAGEVQA